MATKGSRDPSRALQQSIDQLNEAVARLSERLEGVEAGTGLNDGIVRHVRRWFPFYALGAIFALIVILVPTRQNNGNDQVSSTAGEITSGGELGSGETAAGAAGGASSAARRVTGVATPGGLVDLSSPEIRRLQETVDPLAWNKTGLTRGGFNCGPGIRQMPWSYYAVPCYPKWTGTFNGGRTWTGVTDKEIVVVSRHFPESASSQAVNALVAQAGFATGDEVTAADKKFREYFSKVFELWGRKVKYIDYESNNGNSTEEALGGGSQGACLDADEIIHTYHPFMVVGTGAQPAATAPFAVCAAQRHLMTLGAGAYFPEWWYQKYHPWIWNGVMNCTMIAYQNAEYIGKRVARPTYDKLQKRWIMRPAKWAKGTEKGKERVFGIYVPTNVEYQSCVKIADKELQTKYHMHQGSGGKAFKTQYNYQLDISRFPDEAQQGIVQFHAAGVTTIFLACDPLSPIFLTQDASNQGYFPEWVTNGAGLTDVEQFARLWDQPQIQNSLFGMSQLGDTGRILGPQGEGTITYKKATGTTIPPGTQTQYYAELTIFSALQATGPVLTPDNLARAIWRLPAGGAPYFEVGYTNTSLNPDGTTTPSAWCKSHGINHGCQHTSVSDMREIYWVCDSFAPDAEGTSRCQSPQSYDGKGGTYKVTYGGKRFRNGQWPAEDPPIYPGK